MLRRKRNVTLDSNVFISGLARGSAAAKKVIARSTTRDSLKLTDVIYVECVRYADKLDSGVSREEMEERMRKVSPEIIAIELPPDSELRRMYVIRDAKDYRVLYSAEATESEILVTGDKDFFAEDVVGPENVRIIRPSEYLNEGRVRSFIRRLRR